MLPEEFISKMAKYVAFLYREVDVWSHETTNRNTVSLFNDKIEAARDICTMFNCRADVWREAKKIYDF